MSKGISFIETMKQTLSTQAIGNNARKKQSPFSLVKISMISMGKKKNLFLLRIKMQSMRTIQVKSMLLITISKCCPLIMSLSKKNIVSTCLVISLKTPK